MSYMQNLDVQKLKSVYRKVGWNYICMKVFGQYRSDPIGCISLHIVLPVVSKILIRKRACENL